MHEANCQQKLGMSSGIYRSLWYNGKPMTTSPIMEAIPKKDDEPDSPPVLTLSSTVPDDFQQKSDQESDSSVSTDELIKTVKNKITNKRSDRKTTNKPTWS